MSNILETWIINNSPKHEADLGEEITFYSNDQEFKGFYISEFAGLLYVPADGSATVVAYKEGWKNTSYQTVSFISTLSDSLLGWLRNNAVKNEPMALMSVQASNTFTLDIASLEGWQALDEGNYTISIKVEKADGTSSIYSNDILITKEPNKPVVETPIASTVSSFNADPPSSGESTTFTTVLDGGNGTYSATTTFGTVSINGNILTLICEGSGSGTVTVTSGTQTLEIPVYIEEVVCLTGDTLITMFDGTQKPIKDIQTGEYVLSLNEQGERVPGYVYFADGSQNKVGKHYDLFTFSDGTEVKVVHRHRFYNNYDRAFTYLDNFFVGDKCYKQDGTWTALTSKVYRAEEGDINHYTIFCQHNNYFANGLLCGNRFSDKIALQDPDISTDITWSWQPIVKPIPENLNADKIWIGSSNKDIYLEIGGREVNYIQTENNEANLILYYYKGTKNYYDIDISDLQTEGEKILEVQEYDTKFDISGLTWNYMLFYEYKIDRSSPTVLYSRSIKRAAVGNSNEPTKIPLRRGPEASPNG